jgi:hypothetical protein
LLPRKVILFLAALALLLTTGVGVPAQSPSAYTLIDFPDHEGSIEWTGAGSNGGYFRIRYEFRGFYMMAMTPLSGVVGPGRGVTIPPGLRDGYTLIPHRTNVTANWSLSETSSFERAGIRTDCWVEHHTGSDSRTFSAPDKPTLQAILDGRTPPPAGYTVPVAMTVWDTRPAGGDARLALQVSSTLLGSQDPRLAGRTTFTDYEGAGDVDRTDEGPLAFNYMFDAPGSILHKAEIDAGFASPGGFLNVWWDLGEEPQVLGGFSPEKLLLAGTLERQVAPRAPRKPCSYIDGDDGAWTFTLNYRVALRTKIDVTLSPAEPDTEGAWAPEPGQARDYVVTIKEPAPSSISRVRVSLVDTSSNEGVATNLRNHGLPYATCPDCLAGAHTVEHTATETFGGVPIVRAYQQVDICPIDKLPDLFFRDVDNPGFTLEGAAGEGLQYTRAQSLVLERPASTDYVVRVAVRDSGAHARLKAEVEIAGVWLPAKAQGPTADSDGESLMLPLDGNQNGIHDWWENRFRIGSPREDADATPNPGLPGDGLTAFEEYRGIYEEQKLVRTDPTRKNLFVYDAAMRYHQALMHTRALYQPLGLDVMILGENEFWSDVVNYNASEAKKGDQYLIAVMQNPVRPSDVGWREFAENWIRFGAVASYVGPPVREHHTVAMQYRVRALHPGRVTEFMAHEFGHLMGIPHHGDHDDFVDVPASNALGLPAGPHLATTRGGEHSGMAECVMRYRGAALFCVLPRPVPYADIVYRAYPADTTRGTTLCTSAAGSGVNAAGAWAGDATRGNCLAQLQVKSW